MAYLILIVSDELTLNFSRNVRLSEQNRQWCETGNPHKKHQHDGQLLLALPCLLTRNPGQVAFMAGTLGPVSEADKAMGERDYYRLGRLFFDGADADWIATREQISQADVQAAWEFCREKLSYFLTATTGEELKLLSDAELFERAEDCVRLLLHWYEVLSENERWLQAVEEKRSGPGAADEKEL